MRYLSNPNKKAIGSSYCYDQSAGGEMVGGVTVTIGVPRAATGTITIEPTDRRTGKTFDDAFANSYGKIAEEGVREAAWALGIDLNAIDVVVSDFAHHPVDTRRSVYRGAAASAFRSAWDAWRRYPPEDSPER